MTGTVLRVVGFAVIYLFVVTSLEPGDVLVGGLLGLVVVLTTRVDDRRSVVGWGRWFAALVRMAAATTLEIALGTVRVVRFCLGAEASPGFVEIPRGDRSRHGVALWGVLTGEAPDEYPVTVDDARHVLVVHVIDDSDPEAIRARHAAARERHQREVAS